MLFISSSSRSSNYEEVMHIYTYIPVLFPCLQSTADQCLVMYDHHSQALSTHRAPFETGSRKRSGLFATF